MKTKERLAKVLMEASLPDMAEDALHGCYDDFESESATPCIDLVTELERQGKHDLANRARNGEWDATKEESDEWYRRDGSRLLEKMP